MPQSVTLDAIHKARTEIAGRLTKTPILDLTSDHLKSVLPSDSQVSIKLELFQQAGSFKSRGAYIGVQSLSQENREAGVVTVSGGNHALAVSWAAATAGISAKITMAKTVDPMRIAGCKTYNADVTLCDSIADAFTEMERIAKDENRTILHPFEAEHMTLGAATCGAEFMEECADIDIFIIPVGGGGLISGMSSAIKLMKPEATVIGVEPFGADAMFQSFSQGKAVSIGQVNTIADSLGAPMALPYSFGLTYQNVDEIVHISDDEMRASMRMMLQSMKITAEPACASTLAALCGPLRDRCTGKRVGIIACGSNISLDRFQKLIG